MDNLPELLMVIVAILLFIAVFWIPPYIGKKRGISDSNQSTVRLLTVLGLFFGVTWIVGLVLACTYPVAPKPRVQVNQRIPKAFDPIPENFMRRESSELEDFVAQPEQEKCENCGTVIGKLETPSLWKNHVVCEACYEKLSKRKSISAP
jgi:hypothetical protein